MRKNALSALRAGSIRALALAANESFAGVPFDMAAFTELAGVLSGMSPDRVVKVCQKYASILNDMGAKPFDDRDAKTREGQLNHLRHMCDYTLVEIQSAHDDRDVWKAMQGLGFIQGAFFSLEIRTIDQMKEDNGE